MPVSEAQPRVSVIIPTYNECDLLAKTLHNFTRQWMPTDEFEVVVTDDGSSDATRAVADSFSGRLRIKYVFQEDHGYRVGAARNSGARMATAPIFAFLDTGAMAGPGFVVHHAAEHNSPAASRAVIGESYGWRPGDPEIMDGLREAILQLPPEEVVGRFRNRAAFQDERHQALMECDYDHHTMPWTLFLGMNFSVRADDFWAAGGYDEKLSGYGFEDMEFGYRLFRRGLKFRMTSDAWMVEWPHQRDMNVNMREAGINLERFLRKHPEPSVEILWYAFNNSSIWFCDGLYRELAAWRAKADQINVAGELSAAADRTVRRERVAVIGGGGVLPPSLAGATVMDFDQDLLGMALARGGGAGHHVIGLRTPLPEQSVDTVLITSRMAGLWDRWGDDLLAEAHRIGRDVRVLI